MDSHIVTVDDYDARHPSKIPDSDRERVQTLLDDAVSVIMTDAAFSYRKDDLAQLSILKMVSCSMVERRLSTETSGEAGWTTQESVTTGPFTRMFTTPTPLAGMTLLPSERKALGMDDCAIGTIQLGGCDA